MGNNVVKSILVAALLIVLSFSVGVTAAEDAKGAGMIIAASCALVAALCVGKKAWLLLIIMPYYAMYPIKPVGYLPAFTLTFAIAAIVLVYWGTLKIIGNVSFEWKSMPIFDVLFISLIIVGLYAFYRNPVSINKLNKILGIETQNVGGMGYFFMLFSILGYIAYSVIPLPIDKMEKYVKPIVWFVFISALIYTLRLLSTGGFKEFAETMPGEAEATMTNSRFVAFDRMSMLLMVFIYGTKKIREILTRPKYIFILLLSALGIMLTGSRGHIARMMCMLLPLSLMKREFSCLVCAGAIGFSAILVANDADVLRYAPYGVQRAVSVIPGMKIDNRIQRVAQHSLDIRFGMWEVAMDKRTGYIKDYVWGDGFAMDRKQLQRAGLIKMDQADGLMLTGEWHSGPIGMIHRLGYVGFSITTCIFLYMMVMAYRVLKAYQRHSLFPIVLIIVPNVYGEAWEIYGAIADYRHFFSASIGFLFMTKVFYCEGVKKGIIKPLFARSSYVPLAVQERQNEELGLPDYPLPRKLKKL